MINEIVKLRKQGLSFRKIALKLNSTVGKVQYQWVKYNKSEHNHKEGRRSATVFVKKEETNFTRYKSEPKEVLSTPSTKDRNEDYIIAILKNPSTIFVFWSVSELKKNNIFVYFQKPLIDFRTFLRVYDVTALLFNGHNSNMFMDVPIPSEINSWYISGLQPNRSYIIDIGFYDQNNRYFPLLRSSSVHTPRIEIDQCFILEADVEKWKSGKDIKPNWIEHVSTYTLYENNDNEER